MPCVDCHYCPTRLPDFRSPGSHTTTVGLTTTGLTMSRFKVKILSTSSSSGPGTPVPSTPPSVTTADVVNGTSRDVSVAEAMEATSIDTAVATPTTPNLLASPEATNGSAATPDSVFEDSRRRSFSVLSAVNLDSDDTATPQRRKADELLGVADKSPEPLARKSSGASKASVADMLPVSATDTYRRRVHFYFPELVGESTTERPAVRNLLSYFEPVTPDERAAMRAESTGSPYSSQLGSDSDNELDTSVREVTEFIDDKGKRGSKQLVTMFDVDDALDVSTAEVDPDEVESALSSAAATPLRPSRVEAPKVRRQNTPSPMSFGKSVSKFNDDIDPLDDEPEEDPDTAALRRQLEQQGPLDTFSNLLLFEVRHIQACRPVLLLAPVG